MKDKIDYIMIKNYAKSQRNKFNEELYEKIIRIINREIFNNAKNYGILEFIIKNDEWETLKDKKINSPISKTVIEKIKKYYKEIGVSVLYKAVYTYDDCGTCFLDYCCFKIKPR